MDRKGIWLSVLDYAQFKKISISTVRRYIKASRVTVRKVEGRYEIFVAQERMNSQADENEKEILQLRLENQELKNQVKKITEMNNDMKMLIQIYEGASQKGLPKTPQELGPEKGEIQ
jgi:predicted site-specific integrase-resolvase